MGQRFGLFGGILDDDGFKARMKALTDRGRRLARAYTRRPMQKVRVKGAPPATGAYARPVTVKVLYHDRARLALAASRRHRGHHRPPRLHDRARAPGFRPPARRDAAAARAAARP